MKKFDIPQFYRSSIISSIKEYRKTLDPRKKDMSPSILDFGPVRFLIARHFGFCFGVENAIEISYKALEENPEKRIFLLSQMIHNPDVNKDLQDNGIDFIMDTQGNELYGWEKLSSEDIVIIPAFGTTLETETRLKEKGIETVKYNTTCPFVERVWKRTEKLGEKDFTIVIHGKANHEETKATFSHSKQSAPSVIVKDMKEAELLGDVISGEKKVEEFHQIFKGKYTNGFDPSIHLNRIGVVNQTTMLATETKEISSFLREKMVEKYGIEQIATHFADTRDTLCYATNDNQEATYGLLDQDADFAIVVGGYNSSNTSHIVELCEDKIPTYFISGPDEILSAKTIRHFDYDNGIVKETNDFLHGNKKLSVVLTSGASCPDATVELVLRKILSFFEKVRPVDEVLAEFQG